MNLFKCLFALLLTSIAQGGDIMTPELFRKIVTTPGDEVALRPELAASPLWKNAKCTITSTYRDGKVFKEDCTQSTKTVSGNYRVSTIHSKLYQHPVHAIIGYDETASAIRIWGLFGDVLTEGTIVLDPEKQTYAMSSTYAGGFMELSVGSHTAKEATDRTMIYKDGLLFLTREYKGWPVAEAEKPAPDDPFRMKQANPPKASFRRCRFAQSTAT